MKHFALTSRLAAVLIAALAVIDPVFTIEGRTRPELSLIATDGADVRTMAAVERQLARKYSVIHAPFSRAAATVIVGNSLPTNAAEVTGPAFVVVPARAEPALTIDAVAAPVVASIDSRVRVDVTTWVTGARGRGGVVSLVSGNIVVAQDSFVVATDDEHITLPISFVPTAKGASSLRIVARLRGGADSAIATLAVDVRDTRWSILFFDRRPSWMSTFVRRSVENDRRFVVASRVVTSRQVSTDAGHPPSTLEDPTLLDLYDAIVTGAPEALTEHDVAGLDVFLRRRGGGVVLLFDEHFTGGGALRRLTNTDRWLNATSAAPVLVTPAARDSGALRATEFLWPGTLPAESDTLARATISAVDSSPAVRPVVWRTAVGSGRLVVNGAVDAWKFRDATTSGFDVFWRSTIAGVASLSLPPVAVTLSRSSARPGEMVNVMAMIRDVALADGTRPTGTSVGVSIEGDRIKSAVSLWPNGLGTFGGSVPAPAAPGLYRIRVTANGATDDATLVVDSGSRTATRDDRDALAGWVGTRGGSVVLAKDVSRLPGELAARVKSLPRRERWYPMREWWWMVVFAGLLSTEWWWRRRQGLA